MSHLKLYTKQKERGWVLVSVRATIQDETTMNKEYIRNMAPNDGLLSECLRQQKPSEEKEEEERPSWRDKPLHGMYHRQIYKVADIKIA